MTTALKLSERFKPVRAGLLNLYEYGNQVFEFADGHLLLRGHNGAGKSKALELLLPFVLDGDTSPHKLDPFATSSRDMKWNLTLAGRYESRWGYAWLEFGRQHNGEEPEWVTLAVGVRAHQQTPGSTTWFLVVPNRRVGYDLSLVNAETGTPVARRGIREALGEDIEVFDEAKPYRERINEVLFGFPTVERYETLLELQRQLRRPQLSNSLNAHELSSILTKALPEVDHRLIADIGAHLDAIEQLRQDLRSLTGVRDGFRNFVDTYQAYARAVVAERAGEVLAADKEARRVRGELTSKREAAEAVRTKVERLDAEVESVAGELHTKRGAELELLRSDGVRSAHELAELRERITALASGVQRLSSEAEQARAEAAEERQQHDLQREQQRGAQQLAQATDSDMASLATTVGLEHHEALAEQLRASEHPETLAKTMRDAVAERRTDIARQRDLRVVAERCGQEASAREAAAERADGHVRDTESRLGTYEDELAVQRQGLVESAQSWVDTLDVLVLSGEQTDLLLDTANSGGDPNVSLRAALTAPVEAHETTWLRTELELRATREGLAQERAPLEVERESLAMGTPEPPTVYTRNADRSARAGSPLERPRVRGHLIAWVCPAQREGCGVHAQDAPAVPQGVPS